MTPDFAVLARFAVAAVAVCALAILVLRVALARSGRLVRRRVLGRPLEMQTLDRRHTVALLAVEGEHLLLGLGGGSVTLLKRWPASEAELQTASPGLAPSLAARIRSAAGDTSLKEKAPKDTAPEPVVAERVATEKVAEGAAP